MDPDCGLEHQQQARNHSDCDSEDSYQCLSDAEVIDQRSFTSHRREQCLVRAGERLISRRMNVRKVSFLVVVVFYTAALRLDASFGWCNAARRRGKP
jgi:hypothetical protein